MLLIGCGDSDSGGPSTSATTTENVTRPAPGVVEMIDFLNDVKAEDPELQVAPKYLDIKHTSISKEGNNFKFTMELATALPESPEPGIEVEWGFLLDTDRDGATDFGVFADLLKDGWQSGVFNHKSMQRQIMPELPGTFSHSGTTLVITIDGAAIGSPESFKWFAFSDAALTFAPGRTTKVGDKIFEPAVPHESSNWLPFP